MAYKIKLFGDFTYESLRGWLYSDDESIITADLLEQELQKAAGEDLEVDISSVGGYADVATDMIIILRDYKREFKNAELILNIKGMAASAASFFVAAEVWDLITVEDISTWMGHRPFMCLCGDYEVFESKSIDLKRATELYASVYAKRSGKSTNDMMELMRKTTYLYGQEIVDSGFADEVMSTESDLDKDSAFAQMSSKHKAIMKRMRETEHENEKDYLEKVAASLNKFSKTMKQNEAQKSIQTAVGGENNNQEDVIMNVTEFKEKHPDVHAETIMAGRDQEKKSMIENNKAIMDLKNKPEYKPLQFIQERCDEALMNGEDLNDLKMAIMALMIDPKNQAEIESPEDINQNPDTSMSGEGDYKPKMKRGF